MSPHKTTILIASAALALAPTAADAKPLKHGSHGARVQRLQRALHLTPDGVYGRGTTRAVRRFQRRHGLHADGIVGPATWRMIHRAAHGRGHAHAHVRRGAVRVTGRGSSVRLLQRHLGVGADGVFGPGTARAVRRFQHRHGLHADGIVGPATWQVLGVRGRHPVLRRTRLHVRATRPGVPLRVLRGIAAGNRIARLPYRYGGGHGSFHDTGYDCSGSVSYVLHAMGLLSSPLDSSELMDYGSPGPGRYVTIYANPGHAWMIVRGRRFDTSATAISGSRWTSVGRSSAGYVVRHPAGL